MNGTFSGITSGTGANIVSNLTVPVPPEINNYGTNISIRTSTAPRSVPASTTSNTSNLAQLLPLLRNPDAPPTPAAVIVGSPSVPEPIAVAVAETPAPPPVIPPVIPVVIPEPIPSPPVVTNPVLPPIAIAPAPSPSLTSEILTTINRGNSEITPEPPSGTLTLITNPSRVEVASILSNVMPFSNFP